MRRVIAITAVCLGALALPAHAADVQLGRWTLDRTRSQYHTAPMPQSSITTLTPWGKDGIHLSVDVITAKGEASHIAYSAKYDGKQYPRTETGAGATPGQTVSLKKIDDHTVERTVYLNGKSGGTERWMISKDGKTRRIQQSGIDIHGKPINNFQVYVK